MTRDQTRSVAELQALVHESRRVHVRGRGSKSALHRNQGEAAIADLSLMSGIVDYQPSEFTLTVGAGTSIAEIAAALADHGQYLPFDPLLPASASIGGTVASNLSGPRRFRYGGLRDFILGAAVVDGLARAYRVGGKVVKNAAGFDLSKFLVGSLGRYAIMTELTFKVFPDAPQFGTLRLSYDTLADALAAVFCLNQSVYELDALDLLPGDSKWSLLARLGGSADTLPGRLARLNEAMQRETASTDAEVLRDEGALWDPLHALTAPSLVKIVVSPKQLPGLDAQLTSCQRRYSCGGNIAWVATDDLERLDTALDPLGLTGLCLRGDCPAPLLGKPLEALLSARVKQVLDPLGKFV